MGSKSAEEAVEKPDPVDADSEDYFEWGCRCFANQVGANKAEGMRGETRQTEIVVSAAVAAAEGIYEGFVGVVVAVAAVIVDVAAVTAAAAVALEVVLTERSWYLCLVIERKN